VCTTTTSETTPLSAVPFDFAAPPAEGITWNAWEAMPAQEANWTCSACALAWVLRSTGLNPEATEWSEVYEIGTPQNINSQVGLTNANGSALRAVYQTYGQATEQGWLGFDQVYALAQETTGQLSGAAWYHWVALRGVQGNNLWIANSAQGYKGVYDTLSRDDFARLGGFSVVWLV